jgi:hypothetical protein
VYIPLQLEVVQQQKSVICVSAQNVAPSFPLLAFRSRLRTDLPENFSEMKN